MSGKALSIVIGGVSIGVLASVLGLLNRNPTGVGAQCLGCVICLLYLAPGLIAVWHYTSTNQLTITGGEGAGMGAMAGLVAGLTSGILGLLFRGIGLMPSADEIMLQLEQTGALDQMPAEQADMMYQIMEFTTGPIAIVIGVVIGVILGVIGGAIGASLFKKAAPEPPPAV